MTLDMTDWWRVPAQSPELSKVYYGLWDMLPDAAKQSQRAGIAQSYFGINGEMTTKAVALLFELLYIHTKYGTADADGPLIGWDDDIPGMERTI